MIMNKDIDIIDILKSQVQERPDSRLFVSLAEEYHKRDEHEKAINTLIEGLKHLPQYSYARILLVNLYLESQMTHEAYKECQKILAYDPNHVSANKTCARISDILGDNDSANSYYSKVLELKPNDKEAMDFISTLKADVSKKSDAVDKEDKSEQIPIVDERIDDYIKQAELLINQGRYKEAISIYNLMLSKSPYAKDILQKRRELNSLFEMYVAKREKAVKRLKSLKGIFVRTHFKAS